MRIFVTIFISIGFLTAWLAAGVYLMMWKEMARPMPREATIASVVWVLVGVGGFAGLLWPHLSSKRDATPPDKKRSG